MNDGNRNNSSNNKNNTLGYIMLLTTGTLWGMTGFFTNLIGRFGGGADISSFFKELGALFVMSALFPLIGGRHLRISRRGLGLATAQGVLTQCVFVYGYITAISLVGMSTAAVLLYTSPVFVAVMSRILFKEAITRNKVIALIINLIGCALTVTGGSWDLSGVSARGVLWGLVAGVCYGTLPIFSRLAGERDDPRAISYYATLSGFLAITLVIRPWQVTGVNYCGKLWLVVLAFGLVGTAIPYLLYVSGVQHLTEVSRAPVIASVENVSAAVIGVLLFHEVMTPLKALGIVLVLCSVALMNRKTPAEAGK
ncbi:MAG: EamA family transporter [Mogibacterium sp.]|nr:EamA family transporter [Mogibacterium sp.]